MTYPTGLNQNEAADMTAKFGVALDQVRRDYLISLVLAALQAHTDDLIFFGGTALARTYLSEDIDLIAVADRTAVARAISRTIDRALRVTHGRVTWSAPLADIRDTDPASVRRRPIRRTHRHRATAKPHVLSCTNTQAVAGPTGGTDTPDRHARGSAAGRPLSVVGRESLIRRPDARKGESGDQGGIRLRRRVTCRSSSELR
jgi:hypothetical protein